MAVFEIIVLEHPSRKAAEDTGALERLILGPIAMVARDATSAGAKTIAEHGEALKGVNTDSMEVVERGNGKDHGGGRAGLLFLGRSFEPRGSG